MIEIQDKTKCSGCHACARICPKDAIEMVTDGEGFWYPRVNVDSCVKCGLCQKVCPILSPLPKRGKEEIQAYAAYTKDEGIRRVSSSGGVFTELARLVIQEGGVVFGAAFEEDFSLSHQYAERIEDLKKFQGSKYLQSRIGNAYREAKAFLVAGRVVLFTGTPCQIGGLLAFLGKDYQNLITQDIVCHGVPSPSVWKQYVKIREQKNGGLLSEASFRDKDTGWKRYGVRMDFSNNARYLREHDDDPYIKAFLANLSLRPSCYSCSFKGKTRFADITLADLWGAETILPEMDDDKGLSLVCLHSEKGRALFARLSGRVASKSVDPDVAIACNPSMVSSVKRPSKRERFLREIEKGDFDAVTRKYCKASLWRRAVGKLRRLLK